MDTYCHHRRTRVLLVRCDATSISRTRLCMLCGTILDTIEKATEIGDTWNPKSKPKPNSESISKKEGGDRERK